MKRLLTALLVAAVMVLPLAAHAATDKGQRSMEASLRKQIEGHAGLSKKAKAFVIKHLLPTITNPTWVKAIETQNAKKVTLAEIQAIDKKWMAAEEQMPIQKELLENACAKELFKLSKAQPIVREAFVMDDQGANVCMNNLTSDYWQGDEAKWQKSFNDRKGGVDVGKASFDKSANITEQQVSLPILGKGGKVIGAVTFGLAVDQL
jgi:hypothetical protein